MRTRPTVNVCTVRPTSVQVHPQASKEERRSLCRLIDARKLSAEAAAHAVQNDRLPVRCVVQVLFSSEHGGKLSRLADWSAAGSFRSLQQHTPRSPAALDLSSSSASAIAARCPSKREAVAQQQQHELRRLREDVARLQVRARDHLFCSPAAAFTDGSALIS